MSVRTAIPLPHLDARRIGARRIPALIDERLAHAIGVRIAFTGRAGGVSAPPYDELNLGTHVGDDPEAVARNRAAVLEALGVPGAPLVSLSQVHGTDGVLVGSGVEPRQAPRFARCIESGSLPRPGAGVATGEVPEADFAVVESAGTAALLCFADCAPLIVVSPTGRFVVAHAGWRGAVARIASKAVRALVSRDADDLGEGAASSYNAYIGPHIRSECFECGEEVVEAFRAAFGACAVADPRHVDLSAALSADLAQAGLDPARIADAKACTKCRSSEYFSYRASGGVCGRHGAVAVRLS